MNQKMILAVKQHGGVLNELKCWNVKKVFQSLFQTNKSVDAFMNMSTEHKDNTCKHGHVSCQ